MSSLVADYASDSDSDDAGDNMGEANKVQSSDNVEISQTTPAKSQNYLMADDDDSDSSNSDAEVSHTDPQEPKEKLPNPLLGHAVPKISDGTPVTKQSVEGSVFVNRYDNAEMAKKSILEKHVKMTEAHFHTGKKAKICKKFKLGKCFYGDRCQYSHDLDSNLSLRYKKDEPVPSDSAASDCSQTNLRRHSNPHAPHLPPPPRQQGFMGTMNTLNTHPAPRYNKHQQARFQQQQRYMQNVNDAEEVDDDKFNTGDKRKKKVGVSQTLVPPKKAMTSLTEQRQKERPWTVKKKY